MNIILYNYKFNFKDVKKLFFNIFNKEDSKTFKFIFWIIKIISIIITVDKTIRINEKNDGL